MSATATTLSHVLPFGSQVNERGRLEIGYVFNREVSYASGADALLHDTIIMRGELAH